MEDDFRYFLRVRYAECDAQKVVFNARYAEYVDIATTEFFRALGYGNQLASGEIDFQLVRQTIEWRGPARFDDVVEISMRTLRIGNTSFTLAADFRIAGREPTIASAETVYVLVDHRTLNKAPVEGRLRAALEKGAPGIRVDHAAYLAPVSY